MTCDDLTFLHSGTLDTYNGRVDKHYDGYYALQLMWSGGVELCYDDDRYVIEGEWAWPSYPGPRTRFHAALGHAAWSQRYAAFCGPLVKRWQGDGLWPRGPQPAPAGVYGPLFIELLAQLHQPGRWSHLHAINLLERILIQLAEARSQAMRPPQPESWLERMMRQLESQPQGANYQRLAEAAGMSLSTLRRRFRAATGLPLHRYALEARCAAARELLGETDLPIKSIAAQLGYSDVYFFTRQFRRAAGVPPPRTAKVAKVNILPWRFRTGEVSYLEA